MRLINLLKLICYCKKRINQYKCKVDYHLILLKYRIVRYRKLKTKN